MGRQPTISVLIVNYYSTDALRDCLDALAASTMAEALEIIVVDNATPGFDPADIARSDVDMRVLPQACNTTYTGGNNIAFSESRGRFVLLLNPDTRVEPEALERAVNRLEADPGLVAVSAWLTGDDGELRPYYRRLPRLRDVPVVIVPRLLDWTPLSRRYRMADEAFEATTVVEQPAGAFILVRADSCPTPLLEEGYRNFFSDVEFCRELANRGEIRVEPSVRCYHARGGAGLVTYEPAIRSSLHHDLAWGLRRYFRDAGPVGQVWIWCWVLLFWCARVAQAAIGGPSSLRPAVSAARSSLSGKPPSFRDQ